MSRYAAPLRDMRFAIEELAGLAAVSSIPRFSEYNAEAVRQVLEEAGKFAAGVLEPLNRSGDREGARFVDGEVLLPRGFQEAYRRFTASGWNGLSSDTAWGGQGAPLLAAMAVQEMWSSANLALCMCPLLTSAVADMLVLCGSPAQQRMYVPKLVSGEWSGTMNLTEAQAGSDLSAVKTRAVPQGDHYRIQGSKIFVTWGQHGMTGNIVHLVLARTPGAPEGVKGLSLFLVPKYLPQDDGSPGARNDITCVSIENKLGVHASPTCTLAYGDRTGAVGYRIGDENRGLEYMFVLMNQARLGVGIEGVGLSERAYQRALAHAWTRVQGRPAGREAGERVTLIHHPDVRRMLLSMKSRTEAMRGLAYTTAAALDVARHHPDEEERRRAAALNGFLTPVVKGWCTEQCVAIASTGIQIFGGSGFVEDTGAAQLLRDGRVTTIYEGTTGIQAADLVGRKIARERGATALRLIRELASVGDALARSALPEAGAMHRPYAGAVSALSAATHWLLDTYSRDRNAVMAVAVPFLELWGTALGGWVMARAALIAGGQLAQSDADAAFYRGKIMTACFYAAHILPSAEALAHEVMTGAQSVLDADPSWF